MRNFKSDTSGKHVQHDYAKQEFLDENREPKIIETIATWIVAGVAVAFVVAVIISVNIDEVILHGWR